eukprot:11354725-Heterocapsa_arctica.AAC.1
MRCSVNSGGGRGLRPDISLAALRRLVTESTCLDSPSTTKVCAVLQSRFRDRSAVSRFDDGSPDVWRLCVMGAP